MTDTRYRLPNEVATQLQISPSTLRRWSNEFSEYLTDQAGRPQGEDALQLQRLDEAAALRRRVGEALEGRVHLPQEAAQALEEGLEWTRRRGPHIEIALCHSLRGADQASERGGDPS